MTVNVIKLWDIMLQKYFQYFGEKVNHVGLRKYFKNTAWMLSARVMSFLTSFLTLAMVARYLGPENLGKLDYAQSFVAIFSVLASLGIDQILYRDLIKYPDREREIMGTAVLSKLFFGLISLILSVSLSIYLRNETVITVLVLICALTFIISPIGTVSILFSSKVKSKYNALLGIFLAIFIPIIKIVIVLSDKGIIFFCLTILLEAIFSTLWYVFVYLKYFDGSIFGWRFDFSIFKILIRDSWPLLLAGFSGYVYAKIDQVLLLHYRDSFSVGIYSVAVKLTQVWAFLPGLVITSFFPAIVNARAIGIDVYRKRFRRLSGMTISLTAIIALPLYFFAPLIISIIFGLGYIDAVPILRIYLWTSLAITAVLLVQHYFIAENLSRIFLYTSVMGAVMNIILNMLLIPSYGLIGSAVATLISYISVVISSLLFKESRSGLIGIVCGKNR